jgi:hypothetical protein
MHRTPPSTTPALRFLMGGGVTAGYWYGDVAEVRTPQREDA